VALCHSLAGFVNGGVVSSIELDLANTSGAHLSFDGNGTFTFTPDTSGHEFQINSVSGGTGSALNLFGTISGTFTIGAISGNQAPVTGTGVLTISDGLKNLTADISFVTIEKMGTLGALNFNDVVNLTNVHYTGANKDLESLAGGMDQAAVFSFFDSHTLAQLKAGGHVVNTGFSDGLTAATPEPSSMILFAGVISALGGLSFASRRKNGGNIQAAG
jgi:hypothetical protein